jgi:CRISPR-associated protein Csx17
MSEMRHDLVLRGCAPEPLADYLKALGVLRLVATQTDPDARGWWRGDVFVLRTRLSDEELVEFFLTSYVPTPMIGPWNGGSGFYEGDARARIAVEAIEASDDARFTPYREAVVIARRVLEHMGLTEKPAKEVKRDLLPQLRATLPERALPWLDAAVVLTDGNPRFPALLGTGGNDGRLDFTNNQMQRLLELLGPNAIPSQSRAALRAALYGGVEASVLAKKRAVGQFAPSATGGVNSGAGFERDSLVNPWDYVLMLEGAILFAAAVTRRLESTSGAGMALPFAVRAIGAGYGSAAGDDEAESRHELWLPLWDRPSGLAELSALLSEGRAQVGREAVRTAVDFARAIATLGVDRGIESFTRYGFHVRNGRAYFATPLGRWRATDAARRDPLEHISWWVDRLQHAEAGKAAPASLRAVRRGLDDAVLAYCAKPDPASACRVLTMLGEVERLLARAPRARAELGLPPVPSLPRWWLREADDGSPEFRLAAALAGADLRQHLAPVQDGSWASEATRFVWTDASLESNLLVVLARREKDHDEPREIAPWYAALGDVAAFIDGLTDDDRLEALLRGLATVAWNHDTGSARARGPECPLPPAGFALLALAHHRILPGNLMDTRLPIQQRTLPKTPGLLMRAGSGDLAAATRMAVRRLVGAGFAPIADSCEEPRERARRCAAALVFPISPKDRERLAKQVLIVPSSSYTMESEA